MVIKKYIRLIVVISVFSVVFITSIFLCYQFNKNRTTTIINNARRSFSLIMELSANMISSGYFQWDEMYDAYLEDDIIENELWFDDIFKMNKYILTISIIDEEPYFYDDLYAIRNINDELYINFIIADNYSEKFIQDKYIRIMMDKREILKDIQTLSILEFSNSKNSHDFLYGFRVEPEEFLLILFELVCSICSGLLFTIIVERATFTHTRFFYETRGLEKIIFLFEQSERYSANHSRHVATIAHFLGKKMGYKRKALKDLEIAALLHDIGKISVPLEILNKKGKLTREEFDTIKNHPLVSEKIIENFDELRHLGDFIKYHHEKMDGSGYPFGLKGVEIPLESRIIAVADIFEALIGERPYRKPMSPDSVIIIMEDLSLDRNIFAILKAHLHEIYKMTQKK